MDIRHVENAGMDGEASTQEMWRMWRRLCAADRCSPEVRQALIGFGRRRFQRHINHYASRIGHHGATLHVPESAQAWHLFEVHTQIKNTREGKRYKDWLCERQDAAGVKGSTQAMESGVSLLMRDVVREFLRREHSANFMDSLQAPIPVDGCHYTLEELLPDTAKPLNEVADRELEELARTQASDFVVSMNARERILLFAQGTGIPLSDPDLTSWAGCGKSTAHRVYMACLERLSQHIKRNFPQEEPGVWVLLCQKALEELRRLIFLKIGREKDAHRFLKKKGMQVFS